MDKHDEMVKMMDERIKAELMMMAVTNPEKAETCQILMIVNDIGKCGGNIVDAFNEHANIDKPLLRFKVDELTSLLKELSARAGL